MRKNKILNTHNKTLQEENRLLKEMLIKKEEENVRLKQELHQKNIANDKKIDFNNQFKVISNNSPLPTLIIQQGKIKYYNHAFCLLTEYNHEQIDKWQPFEFAKIIHPDHISFFNSQGNEENLKKENFIPGFTLKLISQTGKKLWVEQYTAYIEINNQPARLISMFDITSRKLAENKLLNSKHKLESRLKIQNNHLTQMLEDMREEIKKHKQTEKELIASYEKFNLALKAGNQGFWEYDFKTGTVKYSKEWLELSGVEKIKDLNKIGTWHERIHPDDANKVTKLIRDHIAGKNDFFKFEHRLKTNTQGYIWILIHGRITKRNSDEKPMKAIGTFVDITEQKNTERTIRDSEQQLRAIFDNSTHSFIIVDRDEKINAFNKIAAIFIRNTRKIELKKGLYLFNVIPDTYLPDFHHNFYQSLQGRVISYEEKIYPVNNNTYNWFELSFLPIYDKNAISGVFISILNIDQRKQIEENFLSTIEKERELNELKSQFIATVSHEFRTPLAGISTSAQLLDKKYKKWDEKKKKKIFNRIYNSLNYLEQLLDEISILAKDQSGELKYARQKVNPVPYFEQIIDEINIAYPGNKINTYFNFKNRKIKFDKQLMYHITTNLLSNAVKYSDNKPVDFSLSYTDNILTLTISDKGIGIPAKDIKHIFDPFKRGSNTKSIQGTGLGLAIVKRCIELHNGKINLQSKPGMGTNIEAKIECS